MRTSAWRMGCTVIALAALVSCPGVSFGTPDCSFGGAFAPALPFDAADGFCTASGPLKGRGSVFISPANPLEVSAPGMFLKVAQQPPRFPPVYLAGTFAVLPGGILSTVSPAISGDIDINATGDLLNQQGIFSLVAPFSQVRLRATANIGLTGPPPPPGGNVLANPSTLLIGDYVKLIADKGSIIVQNASMVSYSLSMDFVAPRGDITIRDSIIFVLQDRVNTIGFCRFQPKVVQHVQVGQVNLVNTVLVCVPQIIKN